MVTRVGGGIGIRAWLRTMSRKGCEFKSRPTHRIKVGKYLAKQTACSRIYVVYATHVHIASERAERKCVVEQNDNGAHGHHDKYTDNAIEHVLRALGTFGLIIEVHHKLYESVHEYEKPKREYQQYRRIDDMYDELIYE